jgi:hypothetical protein
MMDYSWLTQGPSSLIDPLHNAYFGTVGTTAMGKPSEQSQGNADGTGMLDWSQFGIDLGNQNAENYTSGNNAQTISDFLKRNNYTFREGGADGRGNYRWVQDAKGRVVGNPMQYSNADPVFLAAMAAAAGVTGGNIALAGAGGGGGSAGLMKAMGGTSPVSPGSLAPAAGEYGALTGSAAETASAGLGGASSPLTAASSGGLLSGLPSWAKTAGEFALKNPKLIGGLLGGLAGAAGSGGEQPYSGPMPTITRGDWKAQVKPQYMAQPNYGLLNRTGTQQPNAGIGRYLGLLGG